MIDKKETRKTEGDEQASEKAKTCFVIMPISSESPYTPGHFDRVFEYIIEPACLRAGFEPVLASRIKAANYIIIDILDQLLKADMVICDVSSRNPNVTYELGFRQAFDLPVTLLRDDITDDIFDIHGLRYARYDHELRVYLAEKEINELAEAISETYAKKDKGVYSLVRVLGWDKAHIKSSNLSDDTQLILEAINNLQNKNFRVNPQPFGSVTSSSVNGYRYTFRLKESDPRSMVELRKKAVEFSPGFIYLDYVIDPESGNRFMMRIGFLQKLPFEQINILREMLNADPQVTTENMFF